MSEIAITEDTLLVNTITYLAAFDKCDREDDYATVWAEFERSGIK